MYKVQFKGKSPTESWSGVGVYGSEAQAISAAMTKKKGGAIMVRVTNKHGGVVYVG